jgi:hypothetical protein
VHLGRVQGRGERRGHRPRTAAQVHDDKRPGLHGAAGLIQRAALPCERDGLLDKELGAAPGNEHAGADRYPQAAELGPAHNVLDRQPGGPPFHHDGEVGGRPRRRKEQPRLVLGEHDAGSPEPGYDGVPAERRGGTWHGAPTLSAVNDRFHPARRPLVPERPGRPVSGRAGGPGPGDGRI